MADPATDVTQMRRVWRWLGVGVRVVAGAVAVTRLVRAARRLPPVSVGPVVPDEAVTVVVPARDEAERIGPLLEAVVGAPGVAEVVVVDDRSSDATAAAATALGARVVAGTEPPDGWAGKAWALQQGIEAATTEWVVTLDADTRPDPRLPAALVARARADELDLLTVGGRFDCPSAGARWIHPALLTTLVYRFGPSGAAAVVPPDRVMANGQCMTLRRERFLDDGGMATVAGHPVEDVALARQRASAGRRVGFLDASALLTVRMYDTFADTVRGWGRSIALPGVEPPARQVLDLAVVALAQAAPLVRLAVGRGDPIDVALLALRLGTLAGTAPAYVRRDAAYWASPLADPLAVAVLARGVVVRRQQWRGRQYDVRSLRPVRTGAR
ncbi:MAG: glycosyltransferase [Ilumatobacteraceae bacterium]|nr:glycosyltransferase [Ilumatobacteraceae bacterium]